MSFFLPANARFYVRDEYWNLEQPRSRIWWSWRSRWPHKLPISDGNRDSWQCAYETENRQVIYQRVDDVDDLTDIYMTTTSLLEFEILNNRELYFFPHLNFLVTRRQVPHEKSSEADCCTAPSNPPDAHAMFADPHGYPTHHIIEIEIGRRRGVYCIPSFTALSQSLGGEYRLKRLQVSWYLLFFWHGVAAENERIAVQAVVNHGLYSGSLHDFLLGCSRCHQSWSKYYASYLIRTTI